MWTAKWFPRKGYLIKYLKFSEVQSERKWRKRWRIRDRRRKRNGGPRGREKGRWGSWCRRIERGQCKLLSAVRNLRMQSWSVENFSLIVFWFLFQGTLHGQGPKKTGRMGRRLKFLFFNFFLEIDLIAVFFTVFYHHHYQMQGFIFMSFILISLFNTRFRSHLISFHFFFFNKK